MSDNEKNTEEKLKDARRLVQLRVNEVSLVDNPANERRFAIVKRVDSDNVELKRSENMSSPENEVVPEDNTPVEQVSEEEVVAKTQFEQDLEACAKSFNEAFNVAEVNSDSPFQSVLKESLDLVMPQIHKMADEAEGDVRSAIMNVTALLNAAQSGMFPQAQVDKAIQHSPSEEVTAPSNDFDAEEGNQTITAGNESPELAADLHLDEEDIEKNKNKQFTSNRTSALKDALVNLAALLKDVNPEAAEEVFTSLELPQNTSNRQEATQMDSENVTKSEEAEEPKAVEENVEKSEETVEAPAAEAAPELDAPESNDPPAWVADLQKSIETIVKNQEDLNSRLATIEKARSPSTSVEDNGTDEPVEKAAPLWAGLL